MLPIIIPELQNRSIISVFCGYAYSCVLTSSGRLLTRGTYSKGALGLGDPGELPVGSPGGYEERVRGQNRQIPDITVLSEVRFDHGLKAKGEVERYCFAATAGGIHTAALVIDLAGDEVPPEDLEQDFKTTVPREGTGHDWKTCCLM